MSKGSQRVRDFFKKSSGESHAAFTHEEISLRFASKFSGEEHSHATEISEGWEEAFGQAVDSFVYQLVRRQEESTARLSILENEVVSLKAKLASGVQGIIAPVETFDPDPYDLLREIKVLILPDDMSFVATIVDASISASGDTIPDAVANLKETMVDLFEILGKLPNTKLGKRPARQLAFLRNVMRKRGR